MIHLVPGHDIARNEELIRILIEESDPSMAAIANNRYYGSAFRYYLFFAEGSALQKSDLSRLTALEVFYNKYYWFLLFTKLHQIQHGNDAGLEQQAFKLLENAPQDIDWDVLKEINRRVESEIANS